MQKFKQAFERKPSTILCSNVKEAIFNHICDILPSLYDESIFRAPSFEHLGKVYFENIRAAVGYTTDDIIQEVIRTMSASDSEFAQQRDYWLALVDLVHVKALPHDVYEKVKKEYNTVYQPKCQNVKKKYKTKLDLLTSEISRLENEREGIKKKIQNKRAVTYDITLDEDRYRTVCSEHYKASTRRAQLEFLYSAICDRLDEFCRIDDSDEQVDIWLRKKSIEIAVLDSNAKTVFLPYISFLSILESDIDDDRFILNQVKILALVDIYREKQHQALSITDESTRQNMINEYRAAMASIPNSDILSAAYKKGSNDYLGELDHLIDEFDVVSLIKDDIDSSYTLRTRSSLLHEILSLYIGGNYTLFNCTAPIQIEGMFADFLYAANTFQRFTYMDLFERDVLNIKLEKLAECSEVDLEVVEYFTYYFTNLVRNRAAHGRYIKSSDPQDDEIFAKELLLDMKCLTHQIRRKAEVEKMLRCIKGYLNYCNVLGTSAPDAIYGALYGDFTGSRMHLSYDSLDQYNSIQFLYWIINPYYGEIAKTMSVDDEVKKIRGYLYSEEFWEYAYNKMQQDISLGKQFSPDVNSAVKCMFKCPLTNGSKRWLGKINKTLQDCKHI
jgi:hypothetical protein